jgi:integrase
MEKTLKEYFGEYTNEITYSERLRPETIRGYGNVFHLFLKIMPEVSTTESLTSEMLNEFFKRINTRIRIIGKDTYKVGVKNSTIKTQYSKLNAFFSWLNKKYQIENPLKSIKPPKVIYEDCPRLKDDEVEKIYASIVLHSSNLLLLRRDTFMVSLLFYCGIRKGEFISLKIRDIDIEKREITIRGETSKSKKTRVLKMHPTLILHLKDYLHERNTRGLRTEDLIVSNKGDKGLSRHGLKHWTENLEEKSGVNFHLHQLRHTFACKLAEANVNLFKIQKMLGHTDIRMTMRYASSMKTEDMYDAICKITI